MLHHSLLTLIQAATSLFILLLGLLIGTLRLTLILKNYICINGILINPRVSSRHPLWLILLSQIVAEVCAAAVALSILAIFSEFCTLNFLIIYLYLLLMLSSHNFCIIAVLMRYCPSHYYSVAMIWSNSFVGRIGQFGGIGSCLEWRSCHPVIYYPYFRWVLLYPNSFQCSYWLSAYFCDYQMRLRSFSRICFHHS